MVVTSFRAVNSPAVGFGVRRSVAGVRKNCVTKWCAVRLRSVKNTQNRRFSPSACALAGMMREQRLCDPVKMAELRLNLLGGFGAHVDGKPPLMLPTRKARALLAVVATAPGMKHGREGLAGMLWERSAEEQARATLRQTLSSIRKALSDGGADGVLYTNADEVGLDPDRCRADALIFEALVEDGAPDALNNACRLYKGDFLAGLSLREE